MPILSYKLLLISIFTSIETPPTQDTVIRLMVFVKCSGNRCCFIMYMIAQQSSTRRLIVAADEGIGFVSALTRE